MGLEEYRYRRLKNLSGGPNRYYEGWRNAAGRKAVKGEEMTFEDGKKITLPDVVAERLSDHQGELIMGIRGEDIKVDEQNRELYKANVQQAIVENTEVMGNENNLYFTYGGSLTVARVSKYELSQMGDKLEFVFSPTKMHFFDKETEENILEK